MCGLEYRRIAEKSKVSMQSGYQPHSSRIKSDHDEHARFDRVARIKREVNTQLPQLPAQLSADPESCLTKANAFVSHNDIEKGAVLGTAA
jgi:hypothetical protein